MNKNIRHCEAREPKQSQKVGGRHALRARGDLRVGFTLIELLVVIAIIGMLSTIAVVALNSARLKGRDAKRIADVRQMQTALALYANDQAGEYPQDPPGVGVSGGLGPTLTALMSDGFVAVGGPARSGTTIMGLIPRDPSMTAAVPVLCADVGPVSTACDYTYKKPRASQFEIRFYLESGAGTLASSGLYCASESGIVSVNAAGAACAH